MINEIKTIIQNYLSNIKLCSLVIGTVTSEGIKISDKLTIPFVLVSGNFKAFIKNGDKVRLLRNLGGQEFYILEIINRNVLLENMKLDISDITIGSEGGTIREVEVKEVIK